MMSEDAGWGSTSTLKTWSAPVMLMIVAPASLERTPQVGLRHCSPAPADEHVVAEHQNADGAVMTPSRAAEVVHAAAATLSRPLGLRGVLLAFQSDRSPIAVRSQATS